MSETPLRSVERGMYFLRDSPTALENLGCFIFWKCPFFLHCLESFNTFLQTLWWLKLDKVWLFHTFISWGQILHSVLVTLVFKKTITLKLVLWLRTTKYFLPGLNNIAMPFIINATYIFIMTVQWVLFSLHKHFDGTL